MSGGGVNTYIPLATSIIGAYCYGYPGLVIGGAIGSMICGSTTNNKDKTYNEDAFRNLNFTCKLAALPYVIGTDMCPGYVMWWDGMKLMDATQMKTQQGYDSGIAYYAAEYRPFSTKFAIAFCANHSRAFPNSYPNSFNIINKVYFDSIDEWNWVLWFQDVMLSNTLSRGNQVLENDNVYLKFIDFRKNTHVVYEPYSGSPVHQDQLLIDVGVPHRHVTWLSYRGWFGNFCALEQYGRDNAYNLSHDKDFNFRQAISIDKFPDVKAEITGTDSILSADGFKVINSYFPAWSGDNSSNLHFYADGLHEFYYYIAYNGVERRNPFSSASEVIVDKATSEATLFKPAVLEWSGHNDGPLFDLSRQDPLHPNHLYIVRVRNSNFASYFNTFSLAYDVARIDRSVNTITSIKYDQVVTGLHSWEPGYSAAFKVHGMELVGDEIYLLGRIGDDAFCGDFYESFIYDYIDGSGARIYGDFSRFPDGFFQNFWVQIGDTDWRSDWGYMIPCPSRKVVNHFSNYIEIDSPFGIASTTNPNYANHLLFTRTVSSNFDFVTVGAGSNRDIIKCACPVNPLRNDGKYSVIIDPLYWSGSAPSPPFPPTNQRTFYVIRWGTGHNDTYLGDDIYLSYPMNRDPVVGERLIIGGTGMDSYYLSPDPSYWVDPDYNARHQNRYSGFKIKYGNNHRRNWKLSNVDGGTYTRFVCLRINKNTGEFLGERSDLSFYPPIKVLGGRLRYDANGNYHTCSMADEMYASVTTTPEYEAGYDTYSFIVNKKTLVKSDVQGGWQPSSGYANYNMGLLGVPAPIETTYLSKLNPDNSFSKAYFFLSYAASHVGYNYTTTMRFVYSPTGQFFSNQNVVLQTWAGGGYGGYGLSGQHTPEARLFAKSPIQNSVIISPFDFGVKLYRWSQPNFSVGISSGNFQCINSRNMYGSWGGASGLYSGYYGTSPFTTFQSSYVMGLMGTLVNFGGYTWPSVATSYHCDANPIDALYNLFNYKNEDFGGGFYLGYGPPNYDKLIPIWQSYSSRFQSSIDTVSKNQAAAVCQAMIDTPINFAGESVIFREPRFQYSRSLQESLSLPDIINDVLQTCQGKLYQCGDSLKFNVPNATETPVWYFGFEDFERTFSPTQAFPWSSGTGVLTMFIDVGDYPNNFFNGDEGYFYCGGIKYSFFIRDHVSGGILRAHVFVPTPSWGSTMSPDGVVTILGKQNIKEGSFTFAQKSRVGRPNRIRIEFQNRLNAYSLEEMEADSSYLQIE